VHKLVAQAPLTVTFELLEEGRLFIVYAIFEAYPISPLETINDVFP